MKVSHAWLQTFFDDPIPDAVHCADLFTFHAFEVEGVEAGTGDSTIDIDVLPNRSSDCLSHRGVARELSTILNRPLSRDPLRDPIPTYKTPANFSVVVDDQHLTPRYIGALMRGIKVGASPTWLREALERVGQRSINNIVDATNYVMLELGQPLHAFDASQLARRDDSSLEIRIRRAKDHETITLLGGDERTLSASTLLVTDGVSGAPLAVAGVKGGTYAEITGDTVDIILESATFHPTSVRKTSQELRCATDASLRFQNEPAPELAAHAMRDLIALITRIAGGTLVGVYDTWEGPRERMPVTVPLTRINALLGTTLSVHDIEGILTRFGWEFSYDGVVFTITSPWERTDLTLPTDFIEEIGRIYGLRNIVARSPKPLSTKPHIAKSQWYGDRIRRELITLGYSEVLTYTLRPDGEVELANPLASDKAFLRHSLSDSIRAALNDNATRAPLLGLSDVRLFEIGTCFTKKGEDIALAIGVHGIRTKQAVLEQELARHVTGLGMVLGTPLHGTLEQGVYEVSLTGVWSLLPEHDAYETPLPWNTDARFAPWSSYPFLLRDIAVWVPSSVPAEEALAIIVTEASSLLVRHDQFDTFEKNGRTSYAWHLVFQANDRTLTDEEVGGVMERIIRALGARPGWEVR